MNRHDRIAHFYGDYRRHTVDVVLVALEFDSPQEAMRWLVTEFVDVELDWHKLHAGSPYPIGLPTVVRSIEQALGTALELEIGTAWRDLSPSQRRTADHNFRRIFGSPELVQGSNSEYCSHKCERWLVLLEDGLPTLDASQEDIRARAAAIRAAQEQIALQRRLAERSQFRDNFNVQVGSLRQQMAQLTAHALAKALASTFFEQRHRIRDHLNFDQFADGHGIYYDLVQTNPAATDLLHRAMRTAAETRDSTLTATLLLLVWGRRPQWSALVDAGLAHPAMARTLEGSSPQVARWWRSVVRGHSHEARLASHGEYNRRRASYLSDLAPLTAVDRLRKIVADDEWRLGALPLEYADPATLTALSDAERTALKLRLMRAPSGAWSRLKSHL